MRGEEVEDGQPAELSIAPAHRRAGLGRLAMADVTKLLRAQGVTALELQIEADHHEARAFYGARGSQAFDRVPMSLPIPPQGSSLGVRAR